MIIEFGQFWFTSAKIISQTCDFSKMRFPAEPLSNQANKIEQIFGFEKNELIILKIVVFQEFRGFSDF